MRAGSTQFVYCPDFGSGWARSMAGIPTPRLMGEAIRVYYYSRDNAGDGRITYIDVAAEDPAQIIHVHWESILHPGEPGDFDDCGVCPSCVIPFGERTFFHYFGIQRLEKIPYMYFGGLAEEMPDGSLIKLSRVPLLERTSEAPHLRSASTVLPWENGLKMWYVSGSSWFEKEGKKFPKYLLKSAVSSDGLIWKDTDEPVLTYANEFEFGFGRPWAHCNELGYHLFYSIRSVNSPYRIGYAHAENGREWTRRDEWLDIEKQAWNAEMTCYPALLSTKYGDYLFFNGNGYGATGFGFCRIHW